jgi:recombinational DNA repair ATPase RecF
MKITRLTVASLRAFEQATFDFDPGFTLLAGVNGVGKTTVLETLRIGLSRLLP